MKKYKAKVTVEYEFEFESDEQRRTNIKNTAEALWENISSAGYEGNHYEDTNIKVEEL